MRAILLNNVHINLEPDTWEVTKRLFDALSEGGKVTMELQEMCRGAYFGSCTDKFGVSWQIIPVILPKLLSGPVKSRKGNQGISANEKV